MEYVYGYRDIMFYTLYCIVLIEIESIFIETVYIFKWRVCIIFIYDSSFPIILMESLILAQSERWRRA